MSKTRIRNTQIVKHSITGNAMTYKMKIYDESLSYNENDIVYWKNSFYRVKEGHSVTGLNENDLSQAPDINTTDWEEILLNIHTDTYNPDADDYNYLIGTTWINIITNQIFVLVDNTPLNAIWIAVDNNSVPIINIYTSDGTIDETRTVSIDNETLRFITNGINGILEITSIYNTNISQFSISNDNIKNIADNGTTNSELGIYPNLLQLRQSDYFIDLTTNGGIITDNINHRGINYADRYHDNYTDRTLIDKEYVDNKMLIDATVGIGGEYTDVKSAINDEKYRLKFVSDVIENESFTFDKTITIYGENYSWDIKNTIRNTTISNIALFVFNLTFDITIDTALFEIKQISLENVIINQNEPAGNDVVFNSHSYSTIYAKYLTINQNNGKIELKYLKSVEYLYIDCNGYQTSIWIGSRGTTDKQYGRNIKIVNGPTAFNTFVIKILTAIIFNIDADNQWIYIQGKSEIHQLKGKVFHLDQKQVYFNSEIQSLYQGWDTCDLRAYSCEISSDIYGEFRQVNVLQDCKIITNVKLTDKSGLQTPAFIDNCEFEGNVTVVNSNNQITNSRLPNGTITIDATADKTILIGNRTQTAIVDNGTNTEMVANVLL